MCATTGVLDSQVVHDLALDRLFIRVEFREVLDALYAICAGRLLLSDTFQVFAIIVGQDFGARNAANRNDHFERYRYYSLCIHFSHASI